MYNVLTNHKSDNRRRCQVLRNELHAVLRSAILCTYNQQQATSQRAGIAIDLTVSSSTTTLQ
jgi:hypothetical protein